MVGVKVYPQFNNKLARFNYLIGVKLAEIFKSYLVEEKRPYPRQTNRRYGRGTTGKKAGTVRDVVDSKDLVNSFIWKSIVKGLYLKNEFVWNAPHAMLVYLGWTSSTGLEIPPWMWVHEALKEINFKEIFRECWAKA